jgi:hypothetical protein
MSKRIFSCAGEFSLVSGYYEGVLEFAQVLYTFSDTTFGGETNLAS